MAEKIAILGGNRIPFARSNGPYARRVQPGHAHRRARRAGRPLRPAGRARRRGRRRRRAQAQPRLQPHARVRARLARSTRHPGLRRPAGVRHRPAGGDGGRQQDRARARSSGASPAASTPPATPRSRVNEDLRQVLLEANRTQERRPGGVKLLGHLRPGHIVPEHPAQRRAAHRPVDGRAPGDHDASEWGISREEQDELTVASHQRLAAAYERGFFDDLVTPYLGLERDQNLRPDSSTDKLAKLKPVFGDDDGRRRRQLDAAVRRRRGRAAGAATSGRRERDLPVLAHLTHSETAAVDYVHGDEGLLMAPVDAVPRLLERAGLTLQDFDLYEIHEAFAAQVLCTLKAWEARTALRRDRPVQAQRRRRLARRRPPVRRHRRADPRHAWRSCWPSAGSRPRADLDLRRRRPGRRRDRGACEMAFSLTLTPAQQDLVERTHRFAEEVIRPVADAVRPRGGVPVAGARAGRRGGLLQPALLPRPDRRPDRPVAAAVHGGAVLGLRRDRAGDRDARARAVGDGAGGDARAAPASGRPSASASRAT